MSKNKNIARKRSKLLNKRNVPGISDAIVDQIITQIVDRNRSLREIAFELNVSYSTLIRRLSQDPKTKALIDEAREVAVFDCGQKLIEIADSATTETLEVDKLRIQARKDAVNLISRTKEGIARSRPQVQEKATTNINVGVVMIPAKASAPEYGQRPKLVVNNGGRVLEHGE